MSLFAESSLHLYGTFFMFGAVLLLLFPICYIILPETKDISLGKNIQRNLLETDDVVLQNILNSISEENLWQKIVSWKDDKGYSCLKPKYLKMISIWNGERSMEAWLSIIHFINDHLYPANSNSQYFYWNSNTFLDLKCSDELVFVSDCNSYNVTIA